MEAGNDKQTAIEVCPACGKNFPVGTAFCTDDHSELIRQMPDPLVGTLLPRHYRITGKLGRGAMSVVYTGVYEPLNQPVAIKLLKSHLVDDLATFKRFQQEAKTVGALEHPHIVTIFDFGVTEQGVPYLIMELLHGESLAQRLLRECSLDVSAAVELFSQTADALDYTHERGVIHRDVKPSNILITKDKQGRDCAKIVDFGIAKLQQYEGNPALNLTATGEVFGTPLYVSPEQAMGKAIDSRADIYSLGCVMYEALAGRPAFHGPTAFDVIRMQISQDPMPLLKARPDVEFPPPLVMCISRSMMKHPDDRYQSMGELLQDLALTKSYISTGGGARQTRTGMPGSLTPTDGIRTSKTQPAWNGVPSSGSTQQPFAGARVSDKVAAVPPKPVRAGRNLPWMLFGMASFAGCMAGLLILAFTGKANLTHFDQSSRGGHSAHAGSAVAQSMDPDAKAYDDKARTLYDQENFAGAEEECQKALKILQEKKQTLAAAVVLTDLCDIQTAEGKYKEAYDNGIQAVDLLEGGPAAQRVDLACALETLGRVVAHEDMKSAEKFYKRALDLKTEALGPKDPEVAKTLHALGVLNEMEGAYVIAADYFNKALKIRQVIPGPNSPETATTLRCLGSLAYKRKHYGESEQLLKQSAAIDKQACGAQSSQYAQDCSCLALLYEAEKKPELAETNYREALKISEKLYGHGSPRLVQRLKNLAQFLRSRHRNVEAQALERTAKDIQAARS